MSYGGRQKLDVRITALLTAGGTLDDEKLKAEIARLACVLACAYLEVASEEIFLAYARARADPRVASYVASQLYWFQNPSLEKLLQLAGQFDPAQRVSLEGAVSDQTKDSVGSILTNRHNIAHGRDSSITLGRLAAYYGDAKKLMQELESLFPPSKVGTT